MSTVTNYLYDEDGNLISTEEVDVPDEPQASSLEELALTEIDAANTATAKINAIRKYLQRKVAENGN